MQNKSHEKSKKCFDQALTLVPGGVHSPVRSFKGLDDTPFFMSHADGAYIYDVDGNNYIDFCMSFGPLILGHKNPIVQKALNEALDRGWSFGACEPYSNKLASFLIDNLPFVDNVRFVNSGTEAVMTALRLARGATNRNKIIKFNGCYHGHVDSMLIKAGSGLAQMSEASSLGVPKGISDDTIVLELNDKQQVINAFEKYKDQIACIIVEPLPANNGLLVQNEEFLHFLRDITRQNKSLLIFDEVISGFRASLQGMAGKLDINPDIVTYGKIVGGGLPVGALAAKTEIMKHLAPLGGVYQAGTLSANPLAMEAGFATLSQLNEQSYQDLESSTQKVVGLLTTYFSQNDAYKNFKCQSYESLFWIHHADQHPQSISQIPADIQHGFKELFRDLSDKGIYLAPNAYEVGFVSLAHDDTVIQEMEKRLWG